MSRFGRRERRDLAIAWLALGVAFTIFVAGPGVVARPAVAVRLFGICLGTAGVGFLGHELAHKLVAERFGREAAFRADYQWLALAILTAMVGILVAAPGAVVHRGPSDDRQIALVAVAGPVTNLLLVGAFAPAALAPWSTVALLGLFGVWINALLAAFNMLPVGPLDGQSVWRYHKGLYFAVAVPAGATALFALTRGVTLPI